MHIVLTILGQVIRVSFEAVSQWHTGLSRAIGHFYRPSPVAFSIDPISAKSDDSALVGFAFPMQQGGIN